jgi:hypothetical protein
VRRAPLQFVAGVFAALSFGCVIAFLSLPALSCLLSISLFIFSISIPLGAFTFITPTYKKCEIPNHISKTLFYLYWLCAISSIVLPPIGFALVFWHLGVPYGAIFSVVAFLSYSLFARISSEIQKEKANDPRNHKNDA